MTQIHKFDKNEKNNIKHALEDLERNENDKFMKLLKTSSDWHPKKN